MISPRSSLCSGSSYNIKESLISSLLFIFFSVCHFMDLRTCISVVLSKRLVVVFSALVSAVYVITGLTYVL